MATEGTTGGGSGILCPAGPVTEEVQEAKASFAFQSKPRASRPSLEVAM